MISVAQNAREWYTMTEGSMSCPVCEDLGNFWKVDDIDGQEYFAWECNKDSNHQGYISVVVP